MRVTEDGHGSDSVSVTTWSATPAFQGGLGGLAVLLRQAYAGRAKLCMKSGGVGENLNGVGGQGRAPIFGTGVQQTRTDPAHG